MTFLVQFNFLITTFFLVLPVKSTYIVCNHLKVTCMSICNIDYLVEALKVKIPIMIMAVVKVQFHPYCLI